MSNILFSYEQICLCKAKTTDNNYVIFKPKATFNNVNPVSTPNLFHTHRATCGQGEANEISNIMFLLTRFN